MAVQIRSFVRGCKPRRAAAATAVMLVLALAGCSSGATPAASGAATPAASGAATPAAAGPVTVRFNILGYDANTPKLYQAAIDDFQAQNPNIHIELTNGTWDQAHAKIVSWINTGDTPDITVLGPKWLPELLSLNGLQPFDSYLSPDFTKNFLPSLFTPLTFNGKLYSVPEAYGTRMMMYRKDLFAKAGITSPPTTWDQYVPDLQKVQSQNPGTYGMAIQGTGDEVVWNFAYYMFGAGGSWTDASGWWALNQPANVAGLQFMTDLVSKYKVTAPNPTAIDQDTLQGLFTSGKAAAYWGPSWLLPILDKSFPGQIGVVPWPTKSGQPLPIYIDDTFVLFKAAKHPAEAVKFMEFWSQDKYQINFAQVEGVMPLTNSAAKDPSFAEPNIAAYIAALPIAHAAYPIQRADGSPLPGWEVVNVATNAAVQAALLGTKTPKQALDDAQAEIDLKVPKN